jgi:enoyl-CoA hydratase
MMPEPDILFEARGRAGVITLNRPRALNALTHGMCLALERQLALWAGDDAIACVVITGAGERAFCAGGDVRAIYDTARADFEAALRFYADEYRLNSLIKHYPKPYVALWHGFVMGGGVGVSVHGSHRLCAEEVAFSMPETGIGFFPDVGGSYFLPRLPGETGTWLGLTGARLGAGDLCALGLAQACVPRQRHARLVDHLAAGTPVAEAIERERITPPPHALLDEHRAAIDRLFAGDRPDDILAALAHDTSIGDTSVGDTSVWAQDMRAELAKKSPTSLAVTLRQIRTGAQLSFDQCMALELRLARHFLRGADFFEGVRAVIIDKDHAPVWRPARLEDVAPETLESYFAD